jgi:thioredoxin reductase (NADPH)
MQLFDTVIVGGGPAGLAAALHLAFHKRAVLVIDRRTGPLFFTLTPLWNVPGFVGQNGVSIQKMLLSEAKKAGAKLENCSVTKISGEFGQFVVETDRDHSHHTRTVLLATGVARYHPLVDGDYTPWLPYAAKGNSFYCPDCEAPELTGKDVVVIGVGGANSTVAEAMPLASFARSIRLLLTGGQEFNPEWEAKRQKYGFEVLSGQIKAVEGKRGHISALVLADGSRVTADAFYVSSPKHPRNDLASQLGLDLGEKGHILTTPRGQALRNGETVAGIWAAGDVQPQTHQVSIALGAGNRAAVMIDQTLTKAGIPVHHDKPASHQETHEETPL